MCENAPKCIKNLQPLPSLKVWSMLQQIEIYAINLQTCWFPMKSKCKNALHSLKKIEYMPKEVNNMCFKSWGGTIHLIRL